jgi:hypothetical protein
MEIAENRQIPNAADTAWEKTRSGREEIQSA